MLPDKITKKFKEISKFFVENFDNSANAIFTVLDMLKLSDKNLCLSTNYNAKYSQTVKFILILLMPFFRIRNFYRKIDCGKDTLYRFKRDNSINFRNLRKEKDLINKLRTDLDISKIEKTSKVKEIVAMEKRFLHLNKEYQKKLQLGSFLFERLKNNESPIKWSNNEILCLLEYISIINKAFYDSLDINYNGLSIFQKLFLVVCDYIKKKRSNNLQNVRFEQR